MFLLFADRLVGLVVLVLVICVVCLRCDVVLVFVGPCFPGFQGWETRSFCAVVSSV